MKVFGKLLFGIVFMLFFGCSGEDSAASMIQDCSRLKDAKILADGEGCCAVKGFAVYMFDNELYTVQGFCSCNEFILSSSTNPINCDSLKLCDFENVVDIQKCILDLKFYENAEYLFNVSFE